MECLFVMDKLEDLSPVMYAEEWDNVGLLVGRSDKEIKTVYIAVDATDEVINNAIEVEADMIITHHPMLIKPMKSVTSDDFIGRRILKLAKHDISCYAMHTNFDVMGMADAAAEEIDLVNVDVLDVTYSDEVGTEGIGRIGNLSQEMPLYELCEFVKERFDVETVKVFGNLDKIVDVCAICPGSGKSVVGEAVKKGADVLITGDIDHHTGIDAVAQGLSIIDAGHFGIEKIFVPYIESFFRREMPEIKVYTQEPVSPFIVV